MVFSSAHLSTHQGLVVAMTGSIEPCPDTEIPWPHGILPVSILLKNDGVKVSWDDDNSQLNGKSHNSCSKPPINI